MLNNKKIEFKHPSNLRNWPETIRLRIDLGARGYGVFLALLEISFSEQGNRNKPSMRKDYKKLSEDIGESPEMIKKIVQDYGLFYEDDQNDLIFLARSGEYV